MSEQAHRIVAAEASDIHDEPHISGSRITVRFVHERVEQADIDPRSVADRHNLDIADVYHALAYYHDNPREMRHVERIRKQAAEDHRDVAITGPHDLE